MSWALLRRVGLALLMLLPVPVGGSLQAQAAPEREAFLEWAREALIPLASIPSVGTTGIEGLAPLGAMIGDARVVALSEAVHAGAEPLQFRNALLEYLVKEKGVTAIAIESGVVEGRVVHSYVQGAPGELADVVSRGIGWTFDQYPQNTALIRWLREYNADPSHPRRVSFYGFDMAGSPGNHLANRGMSTAVEEVLRYLRTVDEAAFEHFQTNLEDLLPNVHVDLTNPAGRGYQRLVEAERDRLTGLIGDLVGLFERREAKYVAASSATDYAWAYRASIAARQVDTWLRQMPVGWDESAGVSFVAEAHEVRDRAQLGNLEWVLDREGADGRVLVFASRFHLSAVPVDLSSNPVGKADMQVLGSYLERRLDDQLVTIGNYAGGGAAGCGSFHFPMEPPAGNTMDALLGELGVPLFVLDLRGAPAEIAEWLGSAHEVGSVESPWAWPIDDGFDVLLYMAEVTPACAGPGPR